MITGDCPALKMMPCGTSLGDHERLAKQTYAGMAHFAATGPEGKTCRECAYWKFEHRYFAKGGRHGGMLKPSPCRKHKELKAGNQEGPPVPHSALACRYFAPAASPPPLREKR
jgi:hypothetical protein